MSKEKSRTRRTFGAVRELPSGRFQAKYTGPDGKWHKAPRTYDHRGDAEGWLNTERKLIDLEVWTPPTQRAEEAAKSAERANLTVQDLCARWLQSPHLKASSADSHRRMLELRVLNTDLADEPVINVDRLRIAEWWAQVQVEHPDTSPTNAYAFRRLRTAFQYAVEVLEVIPTNPVKFKGAATPPRPKVRDRPLVTVDEAKAIAEGVGPDMRTPVELLFWVGLRLGELLGLQRRDLVGLSGTGPVTVRVRRDAERITKTVVDETTGEPVINLTTGKPKTKQVMVVFDIPKTEAANRDVVVPSAVADRLREHCKKRVGKAPDSLVVTTKSGRMMMDTNFRSRLDMGKRAAGREDMTPHDARRFYGTMLVTNGTPLEDARRLMGHETVAQLMEYQRAASGYEQRAASMLDRLISPETTTSPTDGRADDE
ncbi:tyrosine-type recombinase/integrase [Corynebacterium variabile]|uniref:tyrosine-type recombinase/integrase n=1 Tax=Corynebacterium variabile TaxID=1727 RepID=UPI003BB5C5C8